MIKENQKNKIDKKQLIIIGGIILILIVGIVIFTVVVKANKQSQEEILTEKLEQLGASFYEDLYYKQVGKTDEERKTHLEKYSTIGIKVNLDNLARHNSKENEKVVAEFVNEDTDKECDKEKTRAIIYPQEPYKKDSYKIEVELVCGFEEKEK